MLPYVRYNRWAAVYFVVFLVVGLFFLQNLVLATVYQQYTHQTKKKVFKLLATRRTALRAAFEVLDCDARGYIEAGEWMALLRAHLRPDLHRDVARLLFNAIDVDQSGRVNQREFMQLCEFITVQAARVPGMEGDDADEEWDLDDDGLVDEHGNDEGGRGFSSGKTATGCERNNGT